ncbi:hypothetical protein IV203_018577 [Nitzschia inconspicua]|uniref:Uncharacterized protein n=1 Tax=Nitzschia inconspicua TaxID=303405 RepID=A0A9K3K5N1_9STRA|nr:hypothetical protein IV203_033383 [Nitzschia inconspicua]KAG7372434.1 hypothetical protein IV203_018577 [Nitzschia inconspicua]
MLFCMPYGAICLTVFYLAFCLVVGTQLPECTVENEETDDNNCGTEGVNISILAWSTSFFVATIVGFIALHIWWKSSKRIVGGLAFAFIALGSIFNGTATRFFGNDGTDDGKGMNGFYVSLCAYYILMTVSAFLLAVLSHQTWKEFESCHPKSWCRKGTGLLLLLLCLATLVVIGGCIGTLSYGGEDLVETIINDYPEDGNRVPPSLQVMNIGMKLWSGCYSLFLIAVAIIWGLIAKEHPVRIAGLPNSLAAGALVLLQGTVGIFRAILLSLSSSEHIRESAIYTAMPVIINFTMMMTAFFLHNLVVTLYPNDPEDYYGTKLSSPSSTDSDENRDIEAQQTSKSQSKSSVGELLDHQNRDATLRHPQTGKSHEVSKDMPSDDQSVFETEGVEVMGMPRTSGPKKSLSQSLSSNLMARFRGTEEKSRHSNKNTSIPITTLGDVQSSGKAVTNLKEEAISEKSETTFGSQILQKTKAAYEDGSMTSFGSEMLQKLQKVDDQKKDANLDVSNKRVERVVSQTSKDKTDSSETTFGSQILEKMKPVYESSSLTSFGSDMLQKIRGVEPVRDNGQSDAQSAATNGQSCTTFGSEMLEKVKAQRPIYENASQTTFGSEILQKVKRTDAAYRNSHDMTENQGIEVLGIPKQLRTCESGSETTFGSQLLQKAKKKIPIYEEGSNTTFGSEVLQKVRPVYESGSETTFGSEMLQKIKTNVPFRNDGSNQNNESGQILKKNRSINESGSETTFGSEMLQKAKKKIPVYEEGSYTTFGSEVLQKVRPVYESGSETSFGSEMLQKVKRVYRNDDSPLAESDAEIAGVAVGPTNRRLPVLTRFRQKIATFSQDRDESLGSVTTFGSEILYKLKKPEYESESDDTFTSFGSEQLMKIKPRRLKHNADDSSSAASSTTFGSERLIKAKPKWIRYESDGSVTTFGSEYLMKARVEYRAYEPDPLVASATRKTSTRDTVEEEYASIGSSVATSPFQDRGLEHNENSSRKFVGIAATDPSHLENMDKIYGWMSKFVPMEGATRASQELSDNHAEGLQEEFEVKLGTFDEDDNTAEEASEAASQTTDFETEEVNAPGNTSRLRPMRTKKKQSWRKNYGAPQYALDIPSAVEEDADEEASQASSTNGRTSTASSRKNEKGSDIAVAGIPLSTGQYSVEEKPKFSSPALASVAEDVPVNNHGEASPKLQEENEETSQSSLRKNDQISRSGDSFSSGYSVDNSTILSTKSKPVNMKNNILEGGLPKELTESREDDYSNDSDEEDSVSYATSSAAPSAFQSYISDVGKRKNTTDNVSLGGSSVSSVHLNQTKMRKDAMGEVPPPSTPPKQRRRQDSSLAGWALE